jgi:hypothetical protein
MNDAELRSDAGSTLSSSTGRLRRKRDQRAADSGDICAPGRGHRTGSVQGRSTPSDGPSLTAPTRQPTQQPRPTRPNSPSACRATPRISKSPAQTGSSSACQAGRLPGGSAEIVYPQIQATNRRRVQARTGNQNPSRSMSELPRLPPQKINLVAWICSDSLASAMSNQSLNHRPPTPPTIKSQSRPPELGSLSEWERR